MEALLHSLLPLNTICGEALKSDYVDKNLTSAPPDRPCKKSYLVNIYLHMDDCCKSRTDLCGGGDGFLFLDSGVM